jgi:general secretion pathway protein B
MSYILDALKKAEQEREQGAVPGLHAQQVQAADTHPTPAGLSPLVWAGIGVALTLAGVLTWHNWPQAPSPGADAVDTRSADAPAQPAVAPAAPAVAATKPPPTTPAVPSDRQPSARADVAMQVDNGPPGSTRPWPAQPTLSVPAHNAAVPANSPARSPSRESTGQTTLPHLADLPEALRKDMPALAVGGAMHSPVRTQRMLVLNGQVLHEGDSPQAGLQLEEIRLKSAVLNFRGQRFELPF